MEPDGVVASSEKVNEEVFNSNIDIWNAWRICENMLKKNGFMKETKSYNTSQCDVQLATEIYNRVVSMLNEMDVTDDEELILRDDSMDDDIQSCSYTSDEEDIEEWKEDDDRSGRRSIISLHYKKKVVAMANAHPKWSLQTLQKHGALLLKKKAYLKLWEAEIAKGGSKFFKYEKINNMTLQRFQEARVNHQWVTTSMLQEWALSYARELKCDKFNASERWVQRFKRKYKIRQRKKYISKTKVVSAEKKRSVKCSNISRRNSKSVA
ncbi:uncharacterized protein LOC108627179 isoform X2 [Ceratina calcarata]|uniref:Uncharacterized protein LOC108627179 isoform X2 n=1 Tax=Ceratina calcarata TaxID=156304 RepID=A0AAJ7WCC1_9HYME|nr:uncharacterized protein LOC108627179 isoform X2 [Ceratina calcarata]